MTRGRKMLYNTVLLTVTSILMRTVGLSFQIYLTRIIGKEGIGLFQLIMSVSMLASTFAISGIRFTVTRLVSEEIGLDATGNVKRVMRRCLTYALCFGTAALVILYGTANYTGGVWIGDTRAILSIRIQALSLLPLALSSAISGYFTAVCRVIKSSAVQIAEQIVRIAVIVVAMRFIPPGNLEYACAVVVIGNVVGEISSFIFLMIVYLFDKRVYEGGKIIRSNLTGRMFNIALPLAFSAYARTALSMVQNLLIPRGLKKSGATYSQALSDYGMIQGMVFPIITFPSALFYAIAEIIVPELTTAQVSGNKKLIANTVNRILNLSLLFSIGVMGIFYFFADDLSLAIYKTDSIAVYIRVLTFMLPVLYLDSVTDGMLRGLGLHLYSMRYNILDSLISVLLVYFLLPKYALGGFIFMLFFTEVFNFTLSIRRLAKTTTVRIKFFNIIKSLFCIYGSINIVMLLCRSAGFPLSPNILNLAVHILLSAAVYMLMLYLLNCIEKREILGLKRLLKTK
jgi:stage V sporulation protein B